MQTDVLIQIPGFIANGTIASIRPSLRKRLTKSQMFSMAAMKFLN